MYQIPFMASTQTTLEYQIIGTQEGSKWGMREGVGITGELEKVEK